MDFKVTHQKVTRLITELRDWADREDRHTGNELMAKFDLDREAVERIAESEGIDLTWIDPNASTLDLDPDEVQAALDSPDPNPVWVDEDQDTGVWQIDEEGKKLRRKGDKPNKG